jgi:hypothetical protein
MASNREDRDRVGRKGREQPATSDLARTGHGDESQLPSSE